MRLRGILSDGILWLFLLAALVGAYHFFVTLPNSQRQVITLQFHDANEIIEGTNVRLMGVDVGYVNGVEIEDEHVNVKIQMTRDAIQIPEGTTATIKFTGLVGSKSLELMPPEKVKNSGPSMKPPHAYVTVEEPIRLRDTIQYNIDIANALKGGAENFSDFFGRQKPIEELQYNALRSEEKTRAIVGFLDRSLVNLSDFHGRFQTSRAEYRRIFYHLEEGSLKAVEILDRKIFGPSVQPVLNYFDDLFLEAEERLERFKNEGYDTLASQITGQGDAFFDTQKRIRNWNPLKKAGQLESAVQVWRSVVEQMDSFLSKETLPKLKRGRKTLKKVKDSVETWNQKI